MITTTASDLDPTTLGATAAEHTTNIHTAPPAIKAATLITYGGIGSIYIAYPTLMLAKATAHPTDITAIPQHIADGHLQLAATCRSSGKNRMSARAADRVTQAHSCR
jgi:hypothetical protein